MRIQSVSTERKGYYLLREAQQEKASGVLLGMHGYAQLAEEFLPQLAEIPGSEKYHLASIQAPNLFYTKKNQVKASWMSSWQREDAIEDNLRFTQAIVSKLIEEFSGLPISLFGFSQGGAMAYRLAASMPKAFKRLAILGSDFPEDIASAVLPELLLLRGREDSFYGLEKLAEDRRRLTDLGIKYYFEEYSGEHHPNEESRKFLADFLFSKEAV